MKRMLALLFAGALVMGIASMAAAFEKGRQQVKAESYNPGFIMINVIGVEATVEAIDYNNRTATLKSPEVETLITIQVDQSAKTFDRVKVGDQVVTEYIELVAIFFHESNEPATVERLKMVEADLKEERPDGIAINTTNLKATVEAIDYDKSTVTLSGPRGRAVTLNAVRGDQNFNRVKVGHELVAQYTRAIAITVQKPQ